VRAQATRRNACRHSHLVDFVQRSRLRRFAVTAEPHHQLLDEPELCLGLAVASVTSACTAVGPQSSAWTPAVSVVKAMSMAARWPSSASRLIARRPRRSGAPDRLAAGSASDGMQRNQCRQPRHKRRIERLNRAARSTNKKCSSNQRQQAGVAGWLGERIPGIEIALTPPRQFAAPF
jgi:hypothetical protein